MLIETLGPGIRLVKPRSFAGLMTLYAANYASLRQLLGDLRKLPATLISRSPSDFRIYLTVEARSRYTTCLRMTYRLYGAGRASDSPDLELRIYHDARLAEAVSCGDSLRVVGPGIRVSGARCELAQRWTLNMLLRKWLEYCLDHQHRFGETLALHACGA